MTEQNAPTRHGTLHLLCGKMASGKSTLARQLKQQHNAILFSEDEMLATLYPGEISDIASYAERAKRVKKSIENLAVSVLKNGNPVVMDFPANTKTQRAWLVTLAHQAETKHILHFIDLPDEECKQQLLQRAQQEPERAATDTIEMFEAVGKYFEPPTSEEGLTIHPVTKP